MNPLLEKMMIVIILLHLFKQVFLMIRQTFLVVVEEILVEVVLVEIGSMKDIFGNTLNEGTYFSYSTSSTDCTLRFGKVTGILGDKIKLITASRNLNNIWYFQRSILRQLWSIKVRTFVIPRQNLGFVAFFLDQYEREGYGGLKTLDVGGLDDILWKF